jgi:DNA (cytosine-5)-methyltransferase 1
MSAPQREFNFPKTMPQSALRPGEIVVDLFAGGGGASEALEQALGRPVDIAINHDAAAIGMHAANHPFTHHLQDDVWHADPVRLVAGRLVGWFHASPDCTHFSQARGGQPRSRATRALSWCVVKWAGKLAKVGSGPRIISLENVEQILKWGPLIAKRCKVTGRVVKLDGSVAAPGERVSVWEQCLIPDPRHVGRTWSQFVAALEALGYRVEWRKLVASDYGAGTSRKRLFLIARRDGESIRWPAPTHGPEPLQPLVTAADCIDWSIPCPSIFERSKPLADATLRRIARGVKRYVIDSAEPYFVTEHANASAARSWSASEPLRTQCAQVKGGHFALVTAFLEQAAGGPNSNTSRPRAATEPVSTISTKGSQQRLVTAHLATLRGDNVGAAAHAPLRTLSAGGEHHAIVECTLSPEHEAGALRVAAFLINYYGNGQPLDLRDPVDTITTRDRLALVTVLVRGTPYVIVDIGLRMLRREELFLAQGFPADYVIDRTADGRRMTISQSVRMVGNSVSPPPLRALAAANLDPVATEWRAAA